MCGADGARPQVSRGIATRDLGFAPEARALYDDLIGPVAAAALKGKTRLILIPDGALWELPFQALRSPARRYLLEDIESPTRRH